MRYANLNWNIAFEALSEDITKAVAIFVSLFGVFCATIAVNTIMMVILGMPSAILTDGKCYGMRDACSADFPISWSELKSNPSLYYLVERYTRTRWELVKTMLSAFEESFPPSYPLESEKNCKEYKCSKHRRLACRMHYLECKVASIPIRPVLYVLHVATKYTLYAFDCLTSSLS